VLALDFDHQGNLTDPVTLLGRARTAHFTTDQLLAEPGHTLDSQPFVIVPAGQGLLNLERQPQRHNEFANRLHTFLAANAERFDVCLIDTNPNPDIRVIAALACTNFVLSPIQLNQEAISGVNGLLNHPRVGVRKVKAVLNPRLHLIGLLPTMVDPTPFQKANFVQIINRYYPLMIRIGSGPGDLASIPRRSSVAEAQASGEVLWEMKKTAARDAWKEIEPSIRHIAQIVCPAGMRHDLAA
jgi:chromosome partitioning protein